MRRIRSGISAVLTVALSGCGGGISVQSDWDPGFDFSALGTFEVFDEATGGGGLDQLTQNRVKASIANTLQAKGMRRVAAGQTADVAVGWQITTQERSSLQTVSTGWGNYGAGWNRGWYGSTAGVGMTTSRTTETRYQVGTLAIAMFDVRSKAMVFTATGSKTLSGGNPSPEESQKRIDEAVGKILKDFPPASD
jgi:hypothetical protein